MIIRVSGDGPHDEVILTPLEAAFTETACATLAGAETFTRGVGLALLGRVADLRIRPSDASGTVDDDGEFAVKLSVGEDGPYQECTCQEAASATRLCPHGVAVALAATGSVHADDDEADEADEDYVRAAVGVFLAGLPKDDLVDLVLDLADDNEDLADALWEATVRWHHDRATTGPAD
ncbi:hypothetical protein I6A84_14585 [Frankia sp. CNm7]|uniref:SWIM-type domain-containing protein n=1 Tax=Frankia nepalensis TaxID=1836974 RepID=A0A937RA87_9ACTN|nr:hypothetical protein [Frankia nepalensis]MBL7501590.1 hypothetical protein [Frankia nepalensis]MBL7515791.1 hypothetical protein [Frankia nepalensis]MBL7519296.1 hypothetical protein [Frankia nepalensis]MBL7626750.1 hypothetical protein [Frankia nepalensis]